MNRGNNKSLKFGQEARVMIKEGGNDVAKAVAVTMGAKGRNVAIHGADGRHQVTKDGVTVAESIFFKNLHKDFGAQVIKECATKTRDQAGDGTTTSIVLANMIMNMGMRVIETGSNPIFLKKGIDKATKIIIDGLKDMARPVSEDLSDLDFIAKVSANNDDEIGSVISEAIKKVGREGIVNAKGVIGEDTRVEIVDGFDIHSGACNKYFLDDQSKMQSSLENPIILICDHQITQLSQIMPAMRIAGELNVPLLVIAEDIEGEALATMTFNNYKNAIKCAAIKAPASGDIRKDLLEDIATLVGATVISDSKAINIEDINADMLGGAEKIIVKKDKTTIISPYGDCDDIEKRTKELRSQINPELSKVAKRNLEKRIGCLLGKAAIITVGAASDPEAEEKLDRIDDALWATRSAIEEGTIPGGGAAFIHLQHLLDDVECDSRDEQLGVNIVRKAIEQPITQIAKNAGVSEDNLSAFRKFFYRKSFVFTGEEVTIADIIAEVKRSNSSYGWNALTDEVCDLVESGILDPVKVSRIALENAASVAGMLLTTECIIIDSLD